MASSIEPTDLSRHLERYGHRATVITVNGALRPHVGTSLVEVVGDGVIVHVGQGAAGNLADHPDLCLSWSPPEGEDYQLIVDATALEVEPEDGTFRVVAALAGGIRHRVADARDAGPSCLSLDVGR